MSDAHRASEVGTHTKTRTYLYIATVSDVRQSMTLYLPAPSTKECHRHIIGSTGMLDVEFRHIGW